MDGPRKGMTPDPDSQRRNEYAEAVPCEKCGGSYRIGDWPTCKGDRKQHER